MKRMFWLITLGAFLFFGLKACSEVVTAAEVEILGVRKD